MSKVICAWCGLLLRDGTLPASHGLCETCATRLHAELDAEGVKR